MWWGWGVDVRVKGCWVRVEGRRRKWVVGVIGEMVRVLVNVVG